MADTSLLYMERMYDYSGVAHVVDARREDGGRSTLVLDQTLFYPQGGGQASDTGEISTDRFRFHVQSVVYSGGIVLHQGVASEGAPSIGDQVNLSIDAERRKYNSRLQSAGHLMVNAMQKVRPELIAVKGYHFPDGPYVEFEGSPVKEEERDKFLHQLQAAVDELITLNLPVSARFVNREELMALCKGTRTTPPDDKPTRVIIIDNIAQPCGGTHVASLSDLRGLSITRVRVKKGNTRVSYSVPSTVS